MSDKTSIGVSSLSLKIVEDTPDFIAITDLTGRVIYMNRSARATLGLIADVKSPLPTVETIFSPWGARQFFEVGIPAAL
ncbi:MAG: hypothetical protein RLZZ200_1508, partial [Pseudomonadota bacterium]